MHKTTRASVHSLVNEGKTWLKLLDEVGLFGVFDVDGVVVQQVRELRHQMFRQYEHMGYPKAGQLVQVRRIVPAWLRGASKTLRDKPGETGSP